MFSIKNRRFRPSRLLLAMMLVGYALRLLLIVNGGQFYHPDEFRYYRAIEVTKHIFNGDYKNAVKTLLRYDFHQGIAAAKLAPALFHFFVHSLNHDDNLLWKGLWHTPPQNFWLSALIFAWPSALSIGMVYLIARQVGAGETEALLAAFLLAASNSFFLFAKHLLPYDIAILIGLTAVYFAVRPRARSLTNALWVGFLAFLAFWIYNGYVTLTIAIGFLYGLILAQDVRDMLRSTLGMVIGALLFFLPIVACNMIFLRENIILQMLIFSEIIDHGVFSEGAVFPFLYFRDTEGIIALVWLAGLGLAVRRSWRQTPSIHRRRVRLWLACLLSLYLLMALLSTGLQRFVLYGRVVRSLAPFIALACACGFAPYLLRGGRRGLALFIAGMTALALANFIPAIRQQYPLEIAWEVYQKYDDVSFETTIESPQNMFGDWWRLRPEVPTARYKLINAGFYYPIARAAARPEGEVLLEVSHPFNYKPWQYEGMTPTMREIVNRDGVKIWLIDTAKMD